MVHTDTLVLTSDFSVSTRLYINQKNPVIASNDKPASCRPLKNQKNPVTPRNNKSNPLKPHSGYRGSQNTYGDPELNSGIREDGDRLPRYTRNDKPASCRLLTHQKNPVIASNNKSNPLKPHSGYRGSQNAYGDPESSLCWTTIQYSGIREDGDRLPRYTRNDISFSQVLIS